MSTSQNGFPVLYSGSRYLHKWVIPGTGRYFTIRNGSAGFLLAHNALWFHQAIEQLSGGIWDDWGHAVRPVRGQTSGYSNHASGTAVDLNATKHPRGVATSRTFAPTEITRIHIRLRLYGGCIRWGGDYNSTPDGMHFEIDRSLSSCEKQAKGLLDSIRGKQLLDANPGQRAVILS